MTQTNPHPENPLSSTDSPETYSTGDVNQGVSKFETPPALAPIEPDELEHLIGPRCKTKDTEDFPDLGESHCFTCRAWDAIDAYVSKQVDAAVAVELQNVLHDTGGQSDARWTFENVKRHLEQLKKKETI